MINKEIAADIIHYGQGLAVLDATNLTTGFLTNENLNKIAINNWHLSARINSENWYDQLIDAYYRFLKEHPDFSKSHRI